MICERISGRSSQLPHALLRPPCPAEANIADAAGRLLRADRRLCIPSLLSDRYPTIAPQVRGYCLASWRDASDCAASADVTLLELDELTERDIADGVGG